MKIVLLVIAACLFGALALASEEKRVELQPTAYLVAKTPQELSGISKIGDTILIVADGKEDHYLYQVKADGNRFALLHYLDLTQLIGFEQYKSILKSVTEVKKKDRRLDLEGMARCEDDFYLVNERVRHVLLLRKMKSLEMVPIDLQSYQNLYAGGGNAGLEGIAVDCPKQVMYLAKERDPRGILVVDMKTWTLERSIDIEKSNRQGQRVINPWNGEGLFEIGPDISDLYFTDGYLYVLERSTFEIAKVDPVSFAVLARVSYLHTEQPLYQTGEPFGLAEGLYLTDSEIIIAFDNNKNPLSTRFQEKHSIKGNNGMIISFERPTGF